MGALEGNTPVSDNAWETITKGGDAAIKKWISEQMANRTCTVLLIGQNTSNRKWINHEIIETWKSGMGIVGIHIHNLKNKDGNQSTKGSNPLWNITLGEIRLSSIAKAYDPPYTLSTSVYAHIKDNIESWVEEAITIRNAN